MKKWARGEIKRQADKLLPRKLNQQEQRLAYFLRDLQQMQNPQITIA